MTFFRAFILVGQPLLGGWCEAKPQAYLSLLLVALYLSQPSAPEGSGFLTTALFIPGTEAQAGC